MSFAVSRRAVLAAALAAAVVGAGITVTTAVGRASAGAEAGSTATGVEDDGADCPVTVPGSSPANSRLPDPFTKLDGTRITAKSDWRCRREEVKKLAERFVYGTKPAK